MSTASLALAGALVAAAAGLVGAAVHARVRDRRLTFGSLASGALAGAAVLVGEVAAARAVGTGVFPLLHLAYDALTVGVPVASVVALAVLLARPAWRRRTSRLACAALVAGLVPAAVGAWATHVEPYRLRTDEVGLDVAPPPGARPLRVGVLADIQTVEVTDHEREAVRRLMALEPHVVLVAGDVFQGLERTFLRELPELQELLAGLRAPGGVFVVRGDTDSGLRLRQMTEGTGVRVLFDESTRVEVAGWRVTVHGVNNAPAATGAVEALRAFADDQDDPADLRVVLAHRPDVVLDLEHGDAVDLVVAGHTHGGQVHVPFVGPVITRSEVPRHVAAGGLHEVGGHAIYVSTGVGVLRGGAPQVRLGVRPSVGLIEVG